MNDSRWQKQKCKLPFQQATHRLCFVQQQLLKEMMSKNKLDTAQPPEDGVSMPSMGLSN